MRPSGLSIWILTGLNFGISVVLNGFRLIAHSGFWMIFATSGMPPWQDQDRLHADGSALHQRCFRLCQPEECPYAPHVRSSYRTVFTSIGAFSFGGDSSASADYSLRTFTMLSWGVFIVWMLGAHSKDWGDFPLHKPNQYEEFDRLDAEAKRKKTKAQQVVG
jgi:hypothetical protein